ncbi:MAG: hypothetical protein JKY56_18785 [Kofleriaceae bacterium]|nr:hypothetical protein [Kofleriaceae bacterium]
MASIDRIGLLTWLILLFVAMPRSAVLAHVGSDEKVNNRYYKLTPMSDRVRVAYTIFFGRQPSLEIRRGMDLDGDRKISESEKNSYREQLAREVFNVVSVELDHSGSEVRWSEVTLGIGGNSIFDGPFSIDFIGSVCLVAPAPGTTHHLVFRESLRLPLPGETELHLDPAPGIDIRKSILDKVPLTGNEKRWTGGAGPIAKGYELEFTVKNMDSAGMDSLCDPDKDEGAPKTLLVFLVIAAVLAGTAGIFLGRRRACRARKIPTR